MFIVQAGGRDAQSFKLLLFLHFLLAQCWRMKSEDPSGACLQSSTAVSCQYLHLFTVPQSLTTGIKTMDLSHNFIQTLTKTSMSAYLTLLTLDIGFNQLETIEKETFMDLSQLYALNLAANKLYKNSVAHKGLFESMQSLKILNLANNHLDSDMVKGYLTNVTSVEKLDLSGNKMVTLYFQLFHDILQLSELNLSNNYIVKIERGTFDSLKDLKVLNLALNSISCICSFELPQLHFLNLSSNALGFFFTNESQEPYQLTNLDLSHNSLVHFPVLPLKNEIQYLNLSRNQMSVIVPPLGFPLETFGSMSCYEEVAQLYIYNAVRRAGPSLSKLTHLDLRSNQLTSFPLDFLSNLSMLQNLDMAHNCIENMTDASSSAEPLYKQRDNGSKVTVVLKSLKVLDLQGNSLRSVPQRLSELLPEIKQLNLKNNNILLCSEMDNSSSKDHICTSFSGAVHLNYLNLHGNHIKQLPPRVFHQTPIVSLDLSGNKGLCLQEESLEGLERSLQILSLNGNHMVESELNLPCLKALKHLDLSNNRLDVVPSNFYCSHTETLDFQNNCLHTLDAKVTLILSESLKKMWIKGNPFSCCSLKWLESLQVANISVEDINETYCVYLNNVSIRVNLTSDHSQHCVHLLNRGHPNLVIVSVILTLFMLISVMIVFKKRTSMYLVAYRFKSNKIAPETTSSPKDGERNQYQRT